MYLLLSRVLPFDDEDDKEIARQTIYDQADFTFSPWDKITSEGKDLTKSNPYLISISYHNNQILILELLEKNRHKRPALEEVLDHPWFAEFKDI